MMRCNIEDGKAIEEIDKKYNPETVIHLASAVRYSLINSSSHIQSNLVGLETA